MIKDRLIDVDWSSMTTGDRIRHLEVEGFAAFPGTLSPQVVADLRAELSRISTGGAGYTDLKQVHNEIQWAGPFDSVEPWPEDQRSKVSPAVRRLLRDWNTRVCDYDVPSVPSDLASSAHGINPGRWERE